MREITQVKLFYFIIGIFGMLSGIGFFTMPTDVKDCFYVSEATYIAASYICFVGGFIFICISIYLCLLKEEKSKPRRPK